MSIPVAPIPPNTVRVDRIPLAAKTPAYVARTSATTHRWMGIGRCIVGIIRRTNHHPVILSIPDNRLSLTICCAMQDSCAKRWLLNCFCSSLSSIAHILSVNFYTKPPCPQRLALRTWPDSIPPSIPQTAESDRLVQSWWTLDRSVLRPLHIIAIPDPPPDDREYR